LLGNYENHLYDKGGKNDWHYVTINKADDTTLKWSNRAGVSWTLTTTPDDPFNELYEKSTSRENVCAILNPVRKLDQGCQPRLTTKYQRKPLSDYT
jgi:hypothetical protein